ncbi:peptidoglycan-associated lipoprotein Pal [Chromobacterium violaceum]|uniref:Peptidoglycan-associated lipoprotein n=1 Tax=Chromobacterium violaceum (strain ATCC 12472 / DSM 30191 / JCM 1249 / CCUG 213 / NBRC 12614 / NCIMB 9131 / NCTC 9757 / MK) TaxID=243365 RepID=Q7P1V2_CHRVO|nr:peptidoglycan-associated lipoprotein Pal [Chromobacterium violaceum]AAQ57789.1 peptidoglycan-associated lipoprotein [Chromobacterium violaceum ATCC 12472]ATP27000.1 peptidoglycan-associated lipoprotein [Chromobacterium violaceum]ATP30913.1 peptidoglycan-associated lipoprotein [Chromobacterium violaceum]KJH67648.1 membrane protein [Chromobacterium violaceum]KMN49549.1 membrane protein [Chromobacterium violaceum]
MNLKQLALATAVATLLAACASTKPAETPAAPVTQAPTTQAPVTSGSEQNQVAMDPLNDPNSPLAKRSVYFAFDSSAVDGEGKTTVANHADYLKGHDKKVIIQGNTDARGSREYNLALGQRRAESVKHAMEVLGVKESQLEAVSFGKEKPKATGHSDADYAENRRADIVYQGQ